TKARTTSPISTSRRATVSSVWKNRTDWLKRMPVTGRLILRPPSQRAGFSSSDSTSAEPSASLLTIALWDRLAAMGDAKGHLCEGMAWLNRQRYCQHDHDSHLLAVLLRPHSWSGHVAVAAPR